MSESEQLLPVVTLPPFARVVTDLFTALPGAALPHGLLVSFRASGESMYPSIRDGESIAVGPVRAESIVRGDVLLCRLGERLLAHRVVSVAGCGRERILRLRGDAKRDCDAPVTAADVIGRVMSVRRDGRSVRLAGPWARLRYRARRIASRARMLAMPGSAVPSVAHEA
jgi:hypothetical protein